MRRWIALAAALALGLAGVIALREARDTRPPAATPGPEKPEWPEKQERPEAAQLPASLPSLPPGSEAGADTSGAVAELPAAARRYQELRSLQEEARAFFAQQGALSEAEREARAAELRAKVQDAQREGVMLPSEALVLELGLMKATFDDPAVYEHEARSLIEEHAREGERRRKEAGSRPDPRFDAYKRREAEVLSEVLALEEIPDGRSRAEYLRERLQRLRSEIYGGEDPEGIPSAPATPP